MLQPRNPVFWYIINYLEQTDKTQWTMSRPMVFGNTTMWESSGRFGIPNHFDYRLWLRLIRLIKNNIWDGVQWDWLTSLSSYSVHMFRQFLLCIKKCIHYVFLYHSLFPCFLFFTCTLAFLSSILYAVSQNVHKNKYVDET